MPFEQRELSGSLFKNTKKEKETHADYQGTCLIEGVEYWMNAWIKKGKEGSYMSFAFKAKQERKPEKRPAREPGDEDSIPF